MVTQPTTTRTRSVLFVCEYNSCRSQLAEALARRLAPPSWRILSAGLTQSVVNEEVGRALSEIGIDHRELSSKSLDAMRGEWIDAVVVLASPAVREVQERFPNARLVEWPMEDPIRVKGSPEAVPEAVRKARDELTRRLTEWFGSGDAQ